MSSTTSTAPGDGLDELDPACDVALPIGAGQADGVADQRPHPQRLRDVDIVAGPAVAARAIRVTGSPPRRRAADRRVGAGTTVSGGSITPHVSRRCSPASQRDGERRDQVGAAVLLDGDDGFAARPGVAAEREHRHAGIDPRGDQVRFVGLDGQLPRAGGAPPGRRRAAAAALQRQDEVEHVRSVARQCDIAIANSVPRALSAVDMKDLPGHKRVRSRGK